MGTNIMQAPTQNQPGNASAMSFEDMRQALFEAVDRCGGVITRACREIGLPFNTVHRERIRDAAFASDLALRIEAARANRAMDMMALADDHVRSHLKGSLVPLRDEDGTPVLDDDFEQVMVSQLALKTLVDTRREYRQKLDGDGPVVAIQNSNQTVVADVPGSVPHLARPDIPTVDDIVDAEIVTAET